MSTLSSKSRLRAGVALALSAATAAGYVAGGHTGEARAASLPAAVSPAVSPAIAAATPTAPVAGVDFSSIVQKYGPAVVNISVVGHARARPAVDSGDDNGDDDDASPFGQLLPPGFGDGMPNRSPQLMRGLGSGFIISSDGLILTNAHVVDGADEVTVKLTDRREFKAKVLGSDRSTDVAVLRVNAKNLPVVKLGGSSATRVGEPVLAIGSPFGFENSASSGIVSATSRSLPDSNLVPFIQTDVALNPGNSGGPLFNLRGEVVGINSQIYSRTGGYEGLSFAIPIDTALSVQQQLVAHGKVTRSRLGVAIQDMTQPLADAMGLNKPDGALVSSVAQDSAASRAGLRSGDVILAMDGKEVLRSSDLPTRVANATPGSEHKLEILREGKRQTLNVRLDPVAVARMSSDAKDSGRKLGLGLRALLPEEKQATGLASGLVVEQASGPARMRGIQPGDIVISVNGKPVKSVEQLRELAQTDKTLALLVQRDGNRVFIPVQPG